MYMYIYSNLFIIILKKQFELYIYNKDMPIIDSWTFKIDIDCFAILLYIADNIKLTIMYNNSYV